MGPFTLSQPSRNAGTDRGRLAEVPGGLREALRLAVVLRDAKGGPIAITGGDGARGAVSAASVPEVSRGGIRTGRVRETVSLTLPPEWVAELLD